MIKFIRVTTEGPFPGEKRFRTKHNAAMKAGHRAMGEYWIAVVRPAHFTPEAHFRYGYAQRSPAYMARKLKETGKNIDLMYTGSSYRETLLSRVVPTSKRALMKIPAGYFNWTNKGHIDLREELMRLTLRDETEMSAAFQESYDLELERQRGGSTQLLGAA